MRRLFRFLAFTVLALVVLVAIVLVGLATPPGRALVVGMVERAAGAGGLALDIRDTRGWLPFSFGAGRIVVADGEGVFAEVDELDVRVNVLALLTGNVVIDEVAADRVRLDRRPVLPPQEGDAGGGGTPAIAVAAVDLRRLELGPALAGREAALAMTGRASLTGNGGLQARLDGERVDGRMGTFGLAVTRADAAAGFSGDMSVREAENGILIGLLGRTAGPAYQLDASLAPMADGQQGRISLGSAGTARLDGEFSFATGGASRSVRVRANGNLGEFVPTDLTGLLGGNVVVDVEGTWSQGPDLALAIDRGNVSTDAVTAEMSGTLSPTTADLALNVQIAAPAGAPVVLPLGGTSAAFETASVTGTVRPYQGAIRLDLAGHVAGLAVDDVSVPGIGWSVAAEASGLDANEVPFAIRAEADEIAIADRTLQATADAPLLVTAEGTFDRARMAASTVSVVSAAGGMARFDGGVGEIVEGTVSVAWADVAPLARLAGVELAGGVEASAEGRFAGPDGMDLDLKANLADIVPSGSAEAARLLAGTTRASARVRGDAGGALDLSDAALANDQITADGTARLADGNVAASLSGEIADLGLVVEDGAGAARFEADVSGALDAPRVTARATIDDGRVYGRSVSGLAVSVDGGPADGGWRGPVSFQGNVAGADINGSADVDLDAAGQLTLPQVELALADNRLSGAVEQAGAGTFSGRLALDAPRLDQLTDLAGVAASGAFTGDIVLTPENATQTVTVNFEGGDIRFGDTTVSAVSGNARVSDALGTPRVSGSALGQGIVAGGTTLDTVRANAEVSGGVTRFDVAAAGSDIDLRGSGSLSDEGGTPVVRVDALSGTAFGSPLSLGEPVVVRLDESRGQVANVRLAIGGGNVTIDVRALDPLDIAVAARGVAASTVNGFAPGVGASGSIDADATVTGSADSPSIAWNVSLADASVAATRDAGLPPLAITARGVASTTATTVDGRVSRNGLDLAIRGNVPFTGPGLDLTVAGSAPLGLFAAQSAREVRLAGTADVNVSVTGALTSPQIVGAAQLVDATAIDTETGFGLAGANGRVAFDGATATIESITGRLVQGGEATIAGSVGVADPNLPASLTATVRNGRYNDGSAIDAAFAADLAVNGALLGEPEISGQVTLGRTEILLPDLPAGDAAVLETRHVNTAPGFEAPVKPQTGGTGDGSASGGPRLAINISANQGIIVRGFGVDAEFGGNLALTGTAAAPRAVGAFDLVWGRLEVLGKRFTLDTGRISFAGDPVPTVALSASTTTSDAVVTVSVTGRADDPTISFSSVPDLPEEEILSRLLFQRSAGSLSALQAIQLVDALGQLSGVTGESVFTRVRNALGVDDLDIRESASGGTTVGVGTRISDNVRIGVEAGSETDGGRVTIDLDITDNLKARAEADGEGGSKVGITFEREY